MPNTVVKKWINTALNKEIIKVFGNGQRRQDFVHVSDIADAFIKCINAPKVNGIFNIASGSNNSMLELAQAISRKFGTSYEFVGDDDKGAESWNISIDKARNILGFEPKYNSLQAINDLLNTI
jgi:UDP-glucose 4-epimerase